MSDKLTEALDRFLNPQNSLDRILHDDNPIVVAAQWAASFPAADDVERVARAMHAVLVADDPEQWFANFDETEQASAMWRKWAESMLEAVERP